MFLWYEPMLVFVQPHSICQIKVTVFGICDCAINFHFILIYNILLSQSAFGIMGADLPLETSQYIYIFLKQRFLYFQQRQKKTSFA